MIYHPKIRKFTKLFVNDYYKEILCNDNEYYYDIIMKGLILMKGGSNINNNFSNNNSNNDPFMFKLLMRKKNNKRETNINLLQKNSGIQIKNDSRILFYEEKDINNENKSVSILFLGTKKNRCLIMKIIDNNAYLENLTRERKCIKDELFPNTKDIEDMITFSIDYCIKKGVKRIFLNDDSEFNCEGYRISLAKWYILLYGNTYYGTKFGFIPQNNKNHIKKIREKIIDKKLRDFVIDIDDKIFNEFVKKHDSNMSLQDFFREIRKEKRFCYILQKIIDNIFVKFNLKLNEGMVYENICNI